MKTVSHRHSFNSPVEDNDVDGHFKLGVRWMRGVKRWSFQSSGKAFETSGCVLTILEGLCSDHRKCDLQHENLNRFFPNSSKVGTRPIEQGQNMRCLQTWT